MKRLRWYYDGENYTATDQGVCLFAFRSTRGLWTVWAVGSRVVVRSRSRQAAAIAAVSAATVLRWRHG